LAGNNISNYHMMYRSELIEPMDGFHPSGIAQSLIAEGLFEWLEKEYPDAVGPINPNNAKIDQLFGDQGGY
jgi:acyloxyacyl hydrolase